MLNKFRCRIGWHVWESVLVGFTYCNQTEFRKCRLCDAVDAYGMQWGIYGTLGGYVVGPRWERISLYHFDRLCKASQHFKIAEGLKIDLFITLNPVVTASLSKSVI
jgi:hypothetical protein